MAIKKDVEDLADTLGDLGGLLIKRVVRAVQNMEASVSDGFPPEKTATHGDVGDTDGNNKQLNLQRQAMAVVGRSFWLPKLPGTTAISKVKVLTISAVSRDAMGMVIGEDPEAVQMDVMYAEMPGEIFTLTLALILICKEVGPESQRAAD
ncbi:hypothetical protein HAP94_14530 [Acidithiobacillus ferrivorans]|nr:hypothetical protein [Acidithiobacillus ferrivorans]